MAAERILLELEPVCGPAGVPGQARSGEVPT